MSGPIVRAGATPEYWNNWDNIFGKKSKKAEPVAASKKKVAGKAKEAASSSKKVTPAASKGKASRKKK